MTQLMVNLDRSEAQGVPISETIGPFVYIQITYEGIHCWVTEDQEGPSFYNDESGMWYPEKRVPHVNDPWVDCGPDISHHGWTDLTIYMKETV